MEKYLNKYRIAPARLQSWDYASEGMYFITICTKKRFNYFGHIEDVKMVLNKAGQIAEQCWIQLPEHFKNMVLGEYQIMPNHTHGIIIISKKYKPDKTTDNLETIDHGVIPEPGIETGRALSLQQIQPDGNENQHPRFRNQGKNTISAIVGSFKSAVTKLVRKEGIDFGWQERFHDHIIRNYEEFKQISKYIINNPANWKQDKFHR